jgi:hypothetical protein
MAKSRSIPRVGFLFLAIGMAVASGSGQSSPGWRFAVSGDSRDCGDVVMPAIAESVKSHQAAFYWHLGDFRKIYDFDEDMQHEAVFRQKPLSISAYLATAWPDFIENEILPFRPVPVFLGVGNHETIYPKTRADMLAQFADWFNAPPIRRQRLLDDPRDYTMKTYYHWYERGVDFITLDNAGANDFDPAELHWFEEVLRRDERNPAVHSIVVGMHKPFPDSISGGHEMGEPPFEPGGHTIDESPMGIFTGRRAVKDLLRARDVFHKHVYSIASHDHFFIADYLNTDYWRTHGGVLPGWIVGTAGAVRYPLPSNRAEAAQSETNVYGYLLGTVSPDGEILFHFEQIREKDVPKKVTNLFTSQFVNWCFDKNSLAD